MEFYLCGVREPKPNKLVGVHSASDQGGYEGCLSPIEHRHEISQGHLLTGQLQEEGENENKPEVPLHGRR